MGYCSFFALAVGDKAVQPFPYQRRLAEGGWPEAMVVPTGLGKTAAVLVAWLWRRLAEDPATPRRLVYCLPMRVLVEQVLAAAERCVSNVATTFADRGLDLPRVALLMGGDADADWVDEPERPAIIVGTQDMLLSRALMRGYGMSRYRWPVDFAFLHTDALWVFDEVQLMGAGRATSAQLEAFRRIPALAPAIASRTLWVSATLSAEWLSTVDFASHLGTLSQLGLDADPADPDTSHPVVKSRVNAAKAFERASTVLTADKTKGKAVAYAQELAAEILAAHRSGTTTLVILNRVDRAQAVYAALRGSGAKGAVPLLLIHSRFRPIERKACEQALKASPPAAGRIVVATQAIEAGVDMTSATLFTELAPWASLVQRCGRCNRYGEMADAHVFWIDIADFAAQPQLALPYPPEELESSRQLVLGHASASPKALAPVAPGPAIGQVLRRKDLIELFNTDPDLSGFDIDISPYVRDADDTDVQVFWREVGKQPPPDEPRAIREELCPVAIGRFRDFVKKRPAAYIWDGLDRRWGKLDPTQIRPGLTILMDSGVGGYDPELGFNADSKTRVPPVPLPPAEREPPEEFGGDPRTAIGRFVGLSAHLAHVEVEAEALCTALSVATERHAVTCAARWHDVGKAHGVFQKAILDGAPPDRPAPNILLAKSPDKMKRYERRHFRHELASALAWLAHGPVNGPDGDADAHSDLVAYLIAAHHGKVRLGIRALPGEREPDDPRDGRPFARGVWDGDCLPAVDVAGKEHLPAVRLSLAVMALGDGPAGPSWMARTQRLLAHHGPFRLAWLEALVRIADWRASRKEQEAGDEDL